MSGKKTEATDLTSTDAVAKSQKVYGQIVAGGGGGAKGVVDNLDTAHGRGKKKP